MASSIRTPRYGGELPAGVDPLRAVPAALPPMARCFSHGRAALAWFLHSHPGIQWVLVCAYTCPTVPSFFGRAGLKIGFFDIGQSAEVVKTQAAALDGQGLILIPALFGRDPWLKPMDITGPNWRVIIDAAQTGFGHLHYAAPEGGAVLSCPRKACALGSGAVLALSAQDAGKAADDLLPVPKAAAQKRKARSLFRDGNETDEQRALALVGESEAGWPDAPCAMAGEDEALFRRIDPQAHCDLRQRNAAILAKELSDFDFPDHRAGKGGVPFNFPILLGAEQDRSALLAQLRERRIFATALWPDAIPDEAAHPLAAQYRDRLIALPCDQRFSTDDMQAIVAGFRACLSN